MKLTLKPDLATMKPNQFSPSRFTAIIAGLLVLSTVQVRAQSLTDALRVMQNPLPLPGRAQSMAGVGIASAMGYDAVALNPAALAPVPFREFDFALTNFDHTSSANFLQTSSDASLSSTSLGSIGAVFPAKTSRGHFALAIGYDLVQDYTSTYTFSAINPSSSFLNTQEFVQDPHLDLGGQAYRDALDESGNVAWALHLTRDVQDDPGQPITTIPFTGGLLQSGNVTEEGGLHALRVGAGVDVAEGVAIGATLNGYFGTYDYSRSYSETDVNHIYAANNDSLPPLSFQAATINDARHQDQAGIGLTLGLLAYHSDFVRFGLTIETPTVMSIDDRFVRTGSATFAQAVQYSIDADNAPVTINDYDVVSPFRMGGGIALTKSGLTLEADAHYADYSQLSYTDADVDLSDLNTAAKQLLGPVLSWNVAGEYIIAPLGMSLRVGYGSEPSPYKSDPATYATTTFSAGIAALLSPSVMLEASYMQQAYHTDHQLYGSYTVDNPGQFVSATVDNDAVSDNLVALTFLFRY